MKRIKIFISLIMAVAVASVEIYATVVSDNDGSAFISKAEFDSLKNDFQSQLNQYNTAIDSKIDSSIASYLAGIQIAAQERLTNYITNAKKNSEDNVGFMLYGSPKNSRSYNDGYYDVEAAYAVGNEWGVGVGSNVTGSGLYNYIMMNNEKAYDASIAFVDYKGTSQSGGEWTGNVKDFKSAYYWINLPFKGDGETYKNITDWTLKDVVRHRLHMKLEASKLGFSWAQSGSYSSRSALGSLSKISGTTLTTDFTNFEQPGIKEGAEQGTQMVLTLKPVLAQTHSWTQFDKDSDFSSEDDTAANTFLKYNISGTIPDKTISGVEYEKRDYYTSSNVTRTIMLYPPRTDVHSGAYSGTVLGTSWKGERVAEIRGWYNVYNDITYSFKWKNPKNYTLNFRKLTNAYYNNLFTEAHYKYFGIPITNVNKEGKLTFSLIFNNSTNDDYTYCIMDKRFDNGDMPSSKKESHKGKIYERVLKTDTIEGTKGEKEIKFELEKEVIFDEENGDYIYLKIEPSAAGQLVKVDCTKDVMIELKK